MFLAPCEKKTCRTEVSGKSKNPVITKVIFVSCGRENKIESGKVELNCKIDGQNWKDACKKAFDKLAKNIEVKGFRKGQVPENIVKQHVNDQQVYVEACQDIAQQTLIDAIKEKED